MSDACKKCGEPLEAGWIICPGCGEDIDQTPTCSGCGKELKPHWVKCPFCAAVTGQGSTEPAASAPPAAQTAAQTPPLVAAQSAGAPAPAPASTPSSPQTGAGGKAALAYKQAGASGSEPATPPPATPAGQPIPRPTAPAAPVDSLRRPGRVFQDEDYSPPMVIIPAGEFLMGSLERDEEAARNEFPQHKVIIPEVFAVSRAPVTFAEFDIFVRETYYVHQPDDQGWGRGAQPVVDVNWTDAQAYVKWLSGATGFSYRLLTEAEWEYCCRAGSQTRYSWGNSTQSRKCNAEDSKVRWSGVQSSPVCSFEPNAFGLYDMHGNVWEWVEDFPNPNYRGAPEDGSPWTTGNPNNRVLRGGCWQFDSRQARSAQRFEYAKFTRSNVIGFRVARKLD